jgi:hypothetical protein
MRELVEHLQDTIEALRRGIVRNPKGDEYRKALGDGQDRAKTGLMLACSSIVHVSGYTIHC